ncbi:bacterial low temperature requirement A protein-domain-containing protein [Dichotomocladium elegans]|nr:bacterial low temperature requirement A protein-domain-containing protein [Dichotomocladium elegans]
MPSDRPHQYSVRRGPSIRGGYRAPTQRRQNRDTDSINEEEIGLTAETATAEQIEFAEAANEGQQTTEKPIYRHGDETFGDVLSHPIQEYHAHQDRHRIYQQKVEAWENIKSHRKSTIKSLAAEEEFTVVVHFRQLRGTQSFALDPINAEEFASKLRLNQHERLVFNSVRDTDALIDFLDKTKREYSIKIHKQNNKPEHGAEHGHAKYHTIEVNDNVYVEFRPRVPHYRPPLAPEVTRRPFFAPPMPDLSSDIGQEKEASWLELFYDLFYVATLTEFTHSHAIKDWASLGTYAEWFAITWWAWFASTLYTARFDTYDVLHHIWKLIEMCAVISRAGTAEFFLTSPVYVYGYITLKGVLVIEYSIVLIVAIIARSKSSITLGFYVCANLISIALWGSSLAILELPIHRLLWYLGLLIEVLVNVLSRRDRTLSWAASNLAERLGLLTLIVLGENLIGLISLVALSGLDIVVMAPNWCAVIIIFGYFFMYFEDFNKEVFLHSKYHQLWVYLHFPLHLCQVAFGIALIDTLKLYRAELISEGRIHVEEEPHPVEGGSGTVDPTHAADSTGGATHSEGAHAAHKLARRALHEIDLASNESKWSVEGDYERPHLSVVVPPRAPGIHDAGYLTIAKYALTTATFALLETLGPSSAESAILSDGVPVSQQPHNLVKRAGPEGLQVEFSNVEMVFIYKTFLILGGAILIINSLIKLVNTKLTDIYGKIIISSRIINAVVLWSMCALPFAQLHPLVLILVLMGSLIFQAAVDLLD